jgi:nucleotide-binding universal stress UspA family protein
MKLEKILFATDFSPPSQAALRYASSLARDAGATLLIVHVVEPPLDQVYYMPPDYSHSEVRRELESVVPAFKDVKYEQRLLTGIAADEILRVSNEEGVDLIVMGTHGRTGWMRLLMGSVAQAVMRRAPCPVLTLKSETDVPVAAS